MRTMVLLALASLMGCTPDTEINPLVPEIAVAPPSVDFGEQAVPTAAQEILYIANSGRVDLEVELSFAEGGDDVFWVSETSLVVDPDDIIDLPVVFQPDTYLDFSGTLLVQSNDEETPLVSVPLVGTGVHAPMPDIELSETALDFGEVEIGGQLSQWVELANVGGADLQLGTILQEGSGAFHLEMDPSNQIMPAESELLLLVSYRPTNDLGDSGTLTIPSDDPDEPEVQLLLLGNGGGEYEYPVAVVDCDSEVNPPVWVEIDGSASYDPEGLEPLSYDWALTESPAGSQAELSSYAGDTTRFFADSAGDYEVQLMVTNTLDVTSAPARCSVEAVPEEDLHVELTWDTSKADMDLHLAEAGAELFERPGDCNYCNQTPGWGASGDSDDPELALDDRAGKGPENIKILEPADGDYIARVHYFEEHGDGPVEATVRFYLHAELVEEVSMVMERNEVWDVAVIHWPDATVGLYDEDLYEAEERSCF